MIYYKLHKSESYNFLFVCMFSVLDALTQQMGTAISEFAFAQATQKWLFYAPDSGDECQTEQEWKVFYK